MGDESNPTAPNFTRSYHCVPPAVGYKKGTAPLPGVSNDGVLYFRDNVNNVRALANNSGTLSDFVMTIAGTNNLLRSLEIPETPAEWNKYDLCPYWAFLDKQLVHDDKMRKAPALWQTLLALTPDMQALGSTYLKDTGKNINAMVSRFSFAGNGTPNNWRKGPRAGGNGFDMIYGGIVDPKSYWGRVAQDFSVKAAGEENLKGTYKAELDQRFADSLYTGSSVGFTLCIVDLGGTYGKRWQLVPIIRERDEVACIALTHYYHVGVVSSEPVMNSGTDEVIHQQNTTSASAEYGAKTSLLSILIDSTPN